MRYKRRMKRTWRSEMWARRQLKSRKKRKI